MTEDNRDKLTQIADRYSQTLKFYNVEELCADRISEIKNIFPPTRYEYFSIATFYRFFIPYVLPQEIEKAIYLDSDIIVSLDITELWQIELGDKPFGAVPNLFQIEDKDASIERTNKVIAICREGIVSSEDYFNAGVLLMNLKVLRSEEDTLLVGMKFISEHPQYDLLDQDILNYCFSTTYLKLPVKFNRYVLLAKQENDWSIQEKIYHFAASRTCFVMDSRDLFNQLFWSYFIKTPWIDADTKAALSGGLSFQENYPVSVIIPLYNEEEFISECLESLLLQTFQAFEVIVVDDCSTDLSCAVVESYIPIFDGRLRLYHTEENSGGGGYVPRNIGLNLAKGEYVYFLDADDMILSNALETFYAAAILYDAEIVYFSSRYWLNAPNDISLYRDTVSKKMPNTNTEFTVDDPDKNLSRLLFEKGEGNFRSCWTKFVQRDFLMRNHLLFPNISNAGDFLWVINVYCHARRFLRISTPLYLQRRYNANSITRMIREPEEQCCYWFSSFMEFTGSLHELERDNETLAENPIYGLMTLRLYFNWCLNRTDYARKELDSGEIFKVLYGEFSKNFSNSSALLLPFLFSFIDEEKKDNSYYIELINKFKSYITARIDVKFTSPEGNFQILSVSDNEAIVKKPDWLQKNGVGYQIQSYVGELRFVARTTTDGQVTLWLRGVDVRDPEDKSKRIPYWVDYTKLIVNGRTVFDKLTPAWHDERFIHKIKAKAYEEITVQVEWLPHRSDT